MRKFAVTLTLIAFALVTFASTGVAGDHAYVGVKSCGMCHKKDETGNQLGKWTAGPHAQAYKTLGTEEAQAAATAAGLEGNPQELAECLSCHVTAAGVDEALLGKTLKEDGVGCESCHGPGKDYKKKSVMEDRDAAIAAGMIVPTEETCVACHNEKSPTFKGFDFEEYAAKVAHPNPAK